jgi:hypothetical protein
MCLPPIRILCQSSARLVAGTVVSPYKRVIMFVDNAGADVVLGMLPFARELLRMGSEVGGAGTHCCWGLLMVACRGASQLSDVVPSFLMAHACVHKLQVVLVANSLPAINDITAAELKSVSPACFMVSAAIAPWPAMRCHAALCAVLCKLIASFLTYPIILPCCGRRLLPRLQRFAPSSGQLEMQQWRQRRPTMGACRRCQVGVYWWFAQRAGMMLETRDMHVPQHTYPFASPSLNAHFSLCVAMQALPTCGAHPAPTCFPTWVRLTG